MIRSRIDWRAQEPLISLSLFAHAAIDDLRYYGCVGRDGKVLKIALDSVRYLLNPTMITPEIIVFDTLKEKYALQQTLLDAPVTNVSQLKHYLEILNGENIASIGEILIDFFLRLATTCCRLTVQNLSDTYPIPIYDFD